MAHTNNSADRSRSWVNRLLVLLVPPIILRGPSMLREVFRTQHLKYAPDGWDTKLDQNASIGWSVDSVVETESDKWNEFCKNLEGQGPLGFSHEHADLSVVRNTNFHNVHISFAYVAALAARDKKSLSVLDWGGSLGHYYKVARAVLPEVSFDYHVKEVPLIAAAGRRLNPEVKWHEDESCLDCEYDLVMLNGSIMYMPDWAEALHRIARSAREYVFLFRLPIVQSCGSFVSVEKLHGSQMLHLQVNQDELLAVVRAAGLTVVREFVVGEPPYIEDAPEQCDMRGWLLKRK